jgi:hypothetical protein
LASLFPDLDSPTMDDVSREGENSDLHNGSHEQQRSKMEAVIGGWVPQSSTNCCSTCERWQHQNITQVYTRKKNSDLK